MPAPVPPRVSRPAAPPQWPWEVSDDDDLHAVYSDPTVVPAYYAQASVPRNPRPGRPRGLLPMILVGVAVVLIVIVGVVLLTRHPSKASANTDSATVSATRSATPPPTQ